MGLWGVVKKAINSDLTMPLNEQIVPLLQRLYTNMSRRILTIWKDTTDFSVWGHYNSKVVGNTITPDTEGSGTAISPLVSASDFAKCFDIVDYKGEDVSISVVSEDLPEPFMEELYDGSTTETINTAQEIVQEITPTEDFISYLSLNLKDSDATRTTGRSQNFSGAGNMAVLHPSEKWIVVMGTSSSNTIFHTYEVDPILGVLLGEPKSITFNYGNGSQISDLFFTPNGKFVIAAMSYYNQIASFAFDEKAGNMKPGMVSQCTPGAPAYCAKLTPNGNYMIIGVGSSPYICAYAFNQETGIFGAKSTDPATLPANTITDIDINIAGTLVIASCTASPYVYCYGFNQTTGAWGTKYANPANLLSSSCSKLLFNKDNTKVFVFLTAGNIFWYAFNAGAWGALSAQITNTSNDFNQPILSPNGEFIGFSSPSTSQYLLDTISLTLVKNFNGTSSVQPIWFTKNPWFIVSYSSDVFSIQMSTTQSAIVTVEQGSNVYKRLINIGIEQANILIPIFKNVVADSPLTVRIKTSVNNLIIGKKDANTIAYKLYGHLASEKLNCNPGDFIDDLDVEQRYRMIVNFDSEEALVNSAMLAYIE